MAGFAGLLALAVFSRFHAIRRISYGCFVASIC
jgi:hypothetical protein